MEDILLTAGALSVMMRGETVDEPVLVQVLGSLKLDGIVEQHDRYRLVISDGQHVISHVVIAVKLNDMGTTVPPERFSVIHVKEYFTILIPRAGVIRVMLVLTDVQVVFSAGEIKAQIGCPSALFDEDVIIDGGETLSLTEPVFESASTVHMANVSLSQALVQLSEVAVQAPLPVVQARAETTVQPVRALSSSCVPSTSVSRASKRLIVPNASIVRAVDLPTRLSPLPVRVKQPKLQVKAPSTPVTHTATPTPVVKPAAVQLTTAAPQILTPGTSCSSLLTPIANLRPTARMWNIKARVTAKSPVKPWARGSGCSFTVDLADESGEIKATVFTEWVDKYYGMLQRDHVYYISRGNLKTANKRYNHLNHDYELIINGATSVVPCDETVTVAEATYKFVSLSEVKGCRRGTVIDVIGVCTSAAQLESVMTRGGVVPKREVTLVDQSATSVVLKLWGDHAGTFELSNCPIIAIRGAMVKEYWGVLNLTTLVSSVVTVNPGIAEAQQLRKWYNSSTQQ